MTNHSDFLWCNPPRNPLQAIPWQGSRILQKRQHLRALQPFKYWAWRVHLKPQSHMRGDTEWLRSWLHWDRWPWQRIFCSDLLKNYRSKRCLWIPCRGVELSRWKCGRLFGLSWSLMGYSFGIFFIYQIGYLNQSVVFFTAWW